MEPKYINLHEIRKYIINKTTCFIAGSAAISTLCLVAAKDFPLPPLQTYAGFGVLAYYLSKRFDSPKRRDEQRTARQQADYSPDEATVLTMSSEWIEQIKEYYDFVKSRVRPGHMLKSHAVMGIIGEAGELADCLKRHFVYGLELDRENIREELGDLMFYVVAATMANFWPSKKTDELAIHALTEAANDKTFHKRYLSTGEPNGAPNKSPEQIFSEATWQIRTICTESTTLIEFAVRSQTQTHDYLTFKIKEYLSVISDMANLHGQCSLKDIIEGNIRKLEKRYPNGWSREAAILRADKQTR